jgi:hypothetical protein
MRYIIITLSLLSISCASLFQAKPVAPPQIPVEPEIDQVSEIINEIGAVVSTFTLGNDTSIIKDDDFKDKAERKVLSYTLKRSSKARVIEVVIRIVPVKTRIHYTLVIQMFSKSDFNTRKKIELKTTVAEEVVTQARNILSTF